MKKVHYLQAGLAVKDVYKDYHNWSSSSFTIEEFSCKISCDKYIPFMSNKCDRRVISKVRRGDFVIKLYYFESFIKNWYHQQDLSLLLSWDIWRENYLINNFNGIFSLTGSTFSFTAEHLSCADGDRSCCWWFVRFEYIDWLKF